MLSDSILIQNSEDERRWQFARELHEIRASLESLSERYPQQYKQVVEELLKKGDRITPTLKFLTEIEQLALEHYQDNLPN
ncbi:hypothetical protein Riv7116_6940 (plasmid) [Rivularia sp. PCC 7116]|uniref:hypothetical protein n=1 Tax=Rivularia sp. PCC 7116 TaxID=373994 RepID=UPI00029F470A|nr:hypothetical protein [Rivularia sp. PCC 7116]AFY59252.1 hypothetical protein Riv7116_6940 [Rivularia sp. PCC 7116]